VAALLHAPFPSATTTFPASSASPTMAEITDSIKAFRAEFELGSEDENNWKRRNDLCRRLGSACDKRADAPKDLVDNIKPVFQPLLTTCATERTTLGISALSCLSSIFKLLGPQMAFQVDHMVPTLISLCGVTKKLTSKSAGSAMDTVVVSISYNSRLISHVCDAFREKAASTRLFATGWLTTVLQLYGKQLDPVRDFPKIARALLDGLQDSQNTVREAIRPTYWQYARLPGNDASSIMDKLAKDKATALRNHRDNPDKPADAGKPARPASALAQIRAKSKANLKSSTTAKPVSDKPATSAELTKSTDLSSSISSAAARKPLNITSMTSAAARMPPMGRAATAPHGVSKREVSHTTQSTEYASGPIEGATAPDGVFVPLPPSPKEYNNLMAAPVRRPRIVATPINQAPPAVRHQKKPSTSRSKTTTATPQTNIKSDRAAETEQISSDPTFTDLDQKSEATADNEQVSKKSASRGHVTRTVEVADIEQTEIQPTMADPMQTSSEAIDVEQSEIQTPNTDPAIDFEQVTEGQQAEAQPSDTDPAALPSPATEVEQVEQHRIPTGPSSTHIIDGKENTFTFSDGCTHKKAYEACKSRVTDARHELQRLKIALKTGKIDALGYKKLSGLLKDKPGQLLTTQKEYNDLYTTLVDALAVNASINPPAGNAARNRGHPFYNRHALIDSITRLLQQFPDAGEPKPGMALTAVIMCATTHPAGERFRIASTIDDAALQLVQLTNDDSVLATINNVADSLILAQTQSKMQAHSFALGLRSLSALFARAAASAKHLLGDQERLVVDVATTAVADYRSDLGREILGYVAALKGLIAPEERLVALFEREDDRNLIMYYLGR
jgi:hypothetical protein